MEYVFMTPEIFLRGKSTLFDVDLSALACTSSHILRLREARCSFSMPSDSTAWNIKLSIWVSTESLVQTWGL